MFARTAIGPALIVSSALSAVILLAPSRAHAQDCGQFVDVITAPSGRTGNHACDSDHDGAVKDSNYCYCDDCAIQPERCHRRGDVAFCSCDPARQHCTARPCVASGACGAADPTSYYWAIDCNDYNSNRFPENCEICGDGVDDNCNGSTTDCMSTADADGDGFTVPQDCDDNNPNIHPNAIDISCNAIDEDCRGGDDCGSNPGDPDGDGYSAPADCDENDAAVHPGAPDTCGDHKSSDCDSAGLDCPGDQDSDGVAFPADCDDANPHIHPGAFDLCGDRIDQDCAGGDRACVLDQDRDGYDAVSVGGNDCDDLDSSIHPDAEEICSDAIDQDCSGADVDCSAIDQDGDGYKSIAYGGNDCDDDDDSVHPGAPEMCGDGIDSNCDQLPDVACVDQPDRDGDGYLLSDNDCNDRDSRVHPFAVDVCGDHVDNNCNGTADENCAVPPNEENTQAFVNTAQSSCACGAIERTSRGSGRSPLLFAIALVVLLGGRRRFRFAWIAVLLACSATTARADIPAFCYEYNDHDHDNYVYGLTGLTCPRDDCNDNDATVHPGAPEICGDGIDQDCDGADLPCPGADDDRDGFLAVSAGGNDCDDHDATVHIGATEICGDGKDNDCSNGDLPCALDNDHDGYGALSSGGNDCDDNNPSIHPHAAELCGDGIDQDCAGGDPSCGMDTDGDGRVNAALGGDDCDDFDRATHPGATEVCGDGRDQDCDGADLECAAAKIDADGDGHSIQSAGGDDCDDNDPTIHPSATEICGDAIDQDCNGLDLSCGALSGDADNDGYASIEAGGDDCSDSDAAIHPRAVEVCGDGIDQDCDGADALPGESEACLGADTTNPAFRAIRENEPTRTTAPEASSCRTAGGAADGVLLILFGIAVWRLCRRR